MNVINFKTTKAMWQIMKWPQSSHSSVLVPLQRDAAPAVRRWHLCLPLSLELAM